MSERPERLPEIEELHDATIFILSALEPEYTQADSDEQREAAQAVWHRHRDEAVTSLDRTEGRFRELEQERDSLREQLAESRAEVEKRENEYRAQLWDNNALSEQLAESERGVRKLFEENEGLKRALLLAGPQDKRVKQMEEALREAREHLVDLEEAYDTSDPIVSAAVHGIRKALSPSDTEEGDARVESHPRGYDDHVGLSESSPER